MRFRGRTGFRNFRRRASRREFFGSRKSDDLETPRRIRSLETSGCETSPATMPTTLDRRRLLRRRRMVDKRRFEELRRERIKRSSDGGLKCDGCCFATVTDSSPSQSLLLVPPLSTALAMLARSSTDLTESEGRCETVCHWIDRRSLSLFIGVARRTRNPC